MRHPDWPSRLVDFIESRRNSPFVWGSNDCLCFAADALIAMGCDDILAGRRGEWATEAGAKELLSAEGGLEAALDARFPRAAAPKRGDIGMLDDMTVGLVYPPRVIVPGEQHIRMIRARSCRAFWST